MMPSISWIASMCVLMGLVLVAVVDATITTITPIQLAKVEANCANETYSCVLANSDMENWEQVYCCCFEHWTKCRQSAGCDKQTNGNSCRLLTSLDRYFKLAKEKQCDKITECNAAASLQVSTFFTLATGLGVMWIVALR